MSALVSRLGGKDGINTYGHILGVFDLMMSLVNSKDVKLIAKRHERGD